MPQKSLVWYLSDIKRYNNHINYIHKTNKQKRELGWRRQGIDIRYERFLDMLAEQNYQSAICGCTIDEATAHVDHDHTIHVVRALLCNCCNSALGLFGDAIGTLVF